MRLYADNEEMKTHRDERGLIVGWLVKLLVGFAVVAVVLFDAGSIIINFFTLDSKAQEIAISLTTGNVGNTLNQQQIEAEARALAAEAEARLVSVEVDNVERVVRVTLRRRADTLVVGRIGFIRDWTRATADGQAGVT